MKAYVVSALALAVLCAAVPAKADTYGAVTLTKLKTMSQQAKADFAAKNSDAVVTLDTVSFADTKLKATDVEEAANQAATSWGANRPFRIWVSLPMQGLHENPAGWDENLKGISLAASNSLVSGFLFQGYTYLNPWHAERLVTTIKAERPDLLIGEYAPEPQVGHYFWEAFYINAARYAPAVLLVGPKVNQEEFGIKAVTVGP